MQQKLRAWGCKKIAQWKQVECSEKCLKNRKCERQKEREFDERSWKEWCRKQEEKKTLMGALDEKVLIWNTQKKVESSRNLKIGVRDEGDNYRRTQGNIVQKYEEIQTAKTLVNLKECKSWIHKNLNQ
jgi:hypothetical protein